MEFEFELSTFLDSVIKEKIFPGCVVGVYSQKQGRNIIPRGSFTYEQDSSKVFENAIYDVASITKSIPTACLALWLIDNKKLFLDDELIKFVPEFNNSLRGHVTIWHLLTHTLDFGNTHLSAQKDKSPQEILEHVYSREFLNKPGEKFWYMNATSILLGLVIERVTGKSIAVLADEIFFTPLGMKRTTFFPEKFLLSEIAPSEIEDWRGLVHGVVHDETAYTLQKKFIPGHAGLFSTVPDLLDFMEMLLSGGEKNGKRYFSEETIDKMAHNELVSIGSSGSLGWEFNRADLMGKWAEFDTFGKSGFTGCMVMGNMQKGVAIAILSNSTYPKRPDNKQKIKEVRSNIADIVFKHYTVAN